MLASVSVTNSLAWLEASGYPGLLIRDGSGNPSFSETAQELDRILGIPAKKGALPPALMRGVSRYLTEQGYTDFKLEFQGWCHPGGENTGVKIPDLETVKAAIAGGAAIWLFVGFYDYEAETDE